MNKVPEELLCVFRFSVVITSETLKTFQTGFLQGHQGGVWRDGAPLKGQAGSSKLGNSGREVGIPS